LIRSIGSCLLFLLSWQVHSQVVNRITIIGNIKTEEVFILRLLSFKTGDTLRDTTQAKRWSERNLMESGLFHEVNIKQKSFDPKYVEFTVEVRERFHMFILPELKVFETNFNTWLKSPDLRRLSYGLDFVNQNYKGKGIKLIALGRLGYIKAAGIGIEFPFIRKSNWRLAIHAHYNEQAEIVYGTQENKRLFYTNTNSKKVLNTIQFKNYWDYRWSPTNYLRLEGRFNSYNVVDSLASLNTYLPNNKRNIYKFGNAITQRFDFRDNPAYPLRGAYYELSWHNYLYQNGDFFSDLSFDLRKYYQLNNAIYFGLGIKGKYNFQNNLPYQMVEALGYRNYVRGYERYVIDGKDFFLGKFNVVYQIIDTHIKLKPNAFAHKTPIQVYITAFSDVGYVTPNINNFSSALNSTLLSSLGLGLDFVSLYNSVMRFEFAFNRLNEAGIFVHFTQPI